MDKNQFRVTTWNSSSFGKKSIWSLLLAKIPLFGIRKKFVGNIPNKVKTHTQKASEGERDQSIWALLVESWIISMNIVWIRCIWYSIKFTVNIYGINWNPVNPLMDRNKSKNIRYPNVYTLTLIELFIVLKDFLDIILAF